MFVLLGFVVWGIWNSFSNSQSLNTQFCLMYSSFPMLLEHRTIEEGRPLWKTKLLIAETEELRKNSSTNCNKVFYLSFNLDEHLQPGCLLSWWPNTHAVCTSLYWYTWGWSGIEKRIILFGHYWGHK